MNSTFTHKFKPIRKKKPVLEKNEDKSDDEDDDGKFAAFSPVQSESELETDDENENENENEECESDFESVVTYPSDQSDVDEDPKPARNIKPNFKKLLPGTLPVSKNFKILQEDNDFEDEG